MHGFNGGGKAATQQPTACMGISVVGSGTIIYLFCQAYTRYSFLMIDPKIDSVTYIVLRLFQLMMPSHSIGLADLKVARNRGLEHLIRLLRLSDEDMRSPRDVIFVSIDLEVSRQERGSILNKDSHIPHIKELGAACLDSRLIFPLENLPGLTSNAGTRFTSTNQFSTSNASKDFQDCDFTEFQECAFAETFRINYHDLTATNICHSQFQDSTNSNTLRNFAIIGHSIKYDWGIIERLGVDISRIAPVIAMIDTHS